MNTRELLMDISKLTDTTNRKVETLLKQQYPYLHIYVSPDGEINLWVEVNGRSAMAIIPQRKRYIGKLLYSDMEYLEELNEKVKPVSLEPDKYFYCTECGEVKEWTELQDNVFAGYYCKECAKNPQIDALIKASYEKGFYD